MKFHQYVTFREAEGAQEIDAIFNQASADIQNLFGQLYKGTADMVKNYEKASLPEELKRQVLKDLARIAQRIKGNDGTTMGDPRGEGAALPPKTENIMVDTFIKNIAENIQHAIDETTGSTPSSPSIIQDLGSHGTGVGGKKAYDFKTVINNVYRLVMDRMAQLKDAVFRHMGIIRDTHSKVLGLRTTAGNIRNKVSSLSGQLSNPPQPFKGNEEDRAQDSMIALASAASGGFHVKLVGHDGTEIPINPRSETWKQQVLKLGHKHKLFKVIGPGGEEEEVNIGNPGQIHTLLNSWGYNSTSDFAPASRPRSRALGIRDRSGKVVKDTE